MAERALIFLDPFPRTRDMVYPANVAKALEGMGRVVAHFGSSAPDKLVEEILPEVSIIIGQTALPKERLARAPNLRAVLNVKANWEPNIDYHEAHKRGIYVLSAAPAMAPAVAEYCLGQAISLARGLQKAHDLFRKGEEKYGIAGNGNAYSLYGTRVGFVGYGNLGRALAPLLRPFGCTIQVFDPWLSDSYLLGQGLEPAPLLQVLKECQVLFLLAGVTSDNEGFLDRKKLEMIRKDACVILASRAEIGDFNALLELAAKGRFRAAIDVFPQEPVAAEAPFRTNPNASFSAHLAGGIKASYQRICAMMLDDIGQILKGLPPLFMQRAEPGLAAVMRSR